MICFVGSLFLFCFLVLCKGVCPFVGPLVVVFRFVDITWSNVTCIVPQNLALALEFCLSPSGRTKLFYFAPSFSFSSVVYNLRYEFLENNQSHFNNAIREWGTLATRLHFCLKPRHIWLIYAITSFGESMPSLYSSKQGLETHPRCRQTKI